MGTMVVTPGPRLESGGSVASDGMIPGGRICVPPAYVQTSGDAAIPLTSAGHKVAFGFTPEVDFALDALSVYITAVATTGNLAVSIHTDGTAPESNGEFSGSFTNAAPIMTGNAAPSPNVVALRDKNAANAEAGGFEAYRAMDAGTAINNGMRSNAAPTSSDPIFLTLDLGAGYAKAVNRFRFVSVNSADANTRAFPRAFTFWGSNADSPTVNSDADWSPLSGSVSWSAEADPGQFYSRDYYVTNATAFRHYRWKITDRNGSNTYVSLGEIQLFQAESRPAPGSLAQSLGSTGVGSTADVWVRHCFTPYQLQRGRKYWIVFSGEASKNFSLSKRRYTQAAASMFPDSCETKETADGGASWTVSTQTENATVRKATLNVILQSTVNHTTQLVYGRSHGAYIPLYSGLEWVLSSIPPQGICLNCGALMANTRYHVYAYDNSGTLTLEASNLVPDLQDGIEVESGSLIKRLVGIAGMAAVQPGYQGPLDLPDARFVRNRYNTTIKMGAKDPGYLASSRYTHINGASWSRPYNNNDFMVRLVSWDEALPLTAYIMTGNNAVGRIGVGLDGELPQEQCTNGGDIGGAALYGSLRLEGKIDLNSGFHSLYLVVQQGGSFDLVTYNPPWRPQAGIVIRLAC